MKTGIIIMSILSSLTAALAQAIVPAPEPPVPPPVPPITIRIPEQADLKPIEIAEADITADINGVIAETEVTLQFYNPNNTTLEGELYFPLPSESFVAGYALDVNGKLVDGVIVEKEKARVVFEEITRQGIDPGLVEQSAGNVFKTRIYPLPAQGRRTIKVRYVSQIVVTEEDNQQAAYYVQPLRFPNKLESFRLKLNVAAGIKPPKVIGGSLANLEFSNWQTVYTASTELKDIELTEDMYVAIMTRPEESLAVQKAPDGASYFAFHRLLDLAALTAAPDKDTKPAVVLWDASLSRDKSEHDKEIAFLKKALEKCQDITLIVFRNVPEKPLEFKSVDKLVKELESIVYDGGTSIAAALAAVPKGSNVYLFCDGLDTLSAAGPMMNPDDFRLSAFFADKEQNAAFLRGLATRSGGICADLRTTSVEDALRLLAAPAVTVTKVKVDETDVTSAIAWRLDGNRLALAGKLPADGKKLAITVKCDAKALDFQASLNEDSTLLDGRAVKTFFGQLKISQMIADCAPEKELTAAGKEFQLVTPNTSLLVLDSLDQYIRYRVRPPESLPEMRKRYDEAVAGKDEKEEDTEHFTLTPNSPAEVEQLWTALVAWHKKDFPRTDTSTESSKPSNILYRAASAVSNVFSGESVRNEAAPARGMVAPRREAVEEMESDGDYMDIADGAPAPEAPAAQQAEDSGFKTAIMPWDSRAPYLKSLSKAGSKIYEAYLKEREEYISSPGFYMDCADAFVEAGRRDLALRVLTNLAEIELENKQMMRILGYKLRYLGELPQAETVFRRVITMAREEPQSYRDLALTLDDEEKFQEAIDVMMTIVNYKFDRRFPEIEAIALTEANRILARAERKGVKIENFPKQYRHLVDTDLRIVLNWDADMMDIDLWTTDPFGVKCYYGYRNTTTGGRNSCDFTQGYGPEEFMIRDSVAGKYKIQANYYGSHSQKVLGPVTLYTEVYTNYGRPNEKREVLTCRLAENKEVILIGTIEQDGKNVPRHHDEPFDYQVKKGDTLVSIAKQEFGDEGRVDDILALNPGLKADSKLKVGTIIKLPASK